MDMKKFISMTLAASLMTAGICAFAADKEKGEPDVYIDGSKILFSDQNAVIVDDITLVPARGVFEAMGNKVDWDGDARKVTVTSSTGVREVVLTIDSDKMAVKTYKTLFEREDKDITLEVPAKIMNERTMIPLRAVSEAFDCKVDWDGEAYRVDIATGEPILLDGYKAPEKDESKMVGMSLSTDAETVAAGEEFTVYVNATNIPEASRLTGIVATFGYDKNMFEYVEESGALLNDSNEPISASVVAENAEYELGAKVIFVTIDDGIGKSKDGTAFKATFKKLTDGEGTISLMNTYESIYGYGSYLQFTSGDGEQIVDTIYDGKDLALDTTPITIK